MQEMHIDLTKESLDEAEQRVLAKLMQQFLSGSQETKLRKNTVFTLDDPENPQKVTLSHSILKVKDFDKENNPKDSFLVIGKLLGRGSYGKVKLVGRGIKLADETATLQTIEERVLKISLAVHADGKKEQIKQFKQERDFTQKAFEDGVSAVVLREEELITKTYFAMPKKGMSNLHTYLARFHRDREANLYNEEDKKFLLLVCFNLIKALEALHQKGILHRDLKPENVLMDPNTGEVWLIDFGFSEKIKKKPWNTEHIVGSPPFIAPEFFEAQGLKYKAKISEKTDYYALGIMLVMLFIGFDNARRNNENYRKLRDGRADLDGSVAYDFSRFEEIMNSFGFHDLAKKIETLCKLDPTERPQNFEELKSTLDDLTINEELNRVAEYIPELVVELEPQNPTTPKANDAYTLCLNPLIKALKNKNLTPPADNDQLWHLKIFRSRLRALLSNGYDESILIHALQTNFSKEQLGDIKDKISRYFFEQEYPHDLVLFKSFAGIAIEYKQFEEKLETIPLPEIREEAFYKNPRQKALFNRYVVDNLDDVINKQVKVCGLASEAGIPVEELDVPSALKPRTRSASFSSEHKASLPRLKRTHSFSALSQAEREAQAQKEKEKEKVARELLKSIEAIIFETKWSVGVFGGEEVLADWNRKEKTIRVSHTHRAILNAIEKVSRNKETALVALNKVMEITKSATDNSKAMKKTNYKDKVWFFGRSKGTQEFYTHVGAAAERVKTTMAAPAA